MALRRGKRPIYRSNPPLLREMGPKVYDEVCGARTYEGRIVVDEEGQRVNPAFGTYDVKTGRESLEG